MALPCKYVTADEIRCLFNKNRYFERFQEGEFFPRVTPIGPSPPGAPLGGMSQIVRYLTIHHPRVTIAVVHQRAGNQFGDPLGGDRPYPKRLVHDGVDYRYSPKASPSLECPDG